MVFATFSGIILINFLLFSFITTLYVMVQKL